MNLFYQTFGEEGSWLVILHGLFGYGDNWVSLARRWQAHCRVLVVDLPNHGRSPHNEQFDYAFMAGEVEKLLDSLQIEKCNLLGHSMGGKVAMVLATTRPERISRLIVSDIGTRYYPVHHQEIIKALTELEPWKYERRSEAEAAFAESGLPASVRQFLMKNLYRDAKGGFKWRMNLPVISEKIENVGEALPEDAIYEGPVLLIRGDRSDYVKDEELPGIREHFPDLYIETVKNAGHWIHADQPDRMYELIVQFLNN